MFLNLFQSSQLVWGHSSSGLISSKSKFYYFFSSSQSVRFLYSLYPSTHPFNKSFIRRVNKWWNTTYTVTLKVKNRIRPALYNFTCHKNQNGTPPPCRAYEIQQWALGNEARCRLTPRWIYVVNHLAQTGFSSRMNNSVTFLGTWKSLVGGFLTH
jgi:hypothetical protein